MTTTPNPTAEQIAAAAIAEMNWGKADYGEMDTETFSEEGTAVVAALRASGLLGGDPQEPEEAEDVVVFACGQRIPVSEFDAEDDAAPQEPMTQESAVAAVLDRLDEMNNGEISYEVYRELHDLVSVIPEPVSPQESSEDDRAMQIAREIARMHTFTTVDALSIANAALALAAQPVLDPEKVAEMLRRVDWTDALWDDLRQEYRNRNWEMYLSAARALCEAAKRGELT